MEEQRRIRRRTETPPESTVDVQEGNRGSFPQTFDVARIVLEGLTQEIINARNTPLHPDTLPPMDPRNTLHFRFDTVETYGAALN